MGLYSIGEKVLEGADKANTLHDVTLAIQKDTNQDRSIEALKILIGILAGLGASAAGAAVIPALAIGYIVGKGADYVIDQIPKPRVMSDEEFWREWQRSRDERMQLNGIDPNASITPAQRTAQYRHDPLTLDLNGDGIQTVPLSTPPLFFDLTASGIKTSVGWIAPSDGLLVMDRNGNGMIDSGAELFGDATPAYDAAGNPTTGRTADGFAALAQEDTNGDGVVNNLDTNFASLRVWQDLNQDGISQSNELSSLDEQGIVSFDVNAAWQSILSLIMCHLYTPRIINNGGHKPTRIIGDVSAIKNPRFKRGFFIAPETIPYANFITPPLQSTLMVSFAA